MLYNYQHLNIPIFIVIVLLFSTNTYANKEDKLKGYINIGYSDNFHSDSSHLDDQKAIWETYASYKLSDSYSGYLFLSGDKSYDGETGTFANDTLAGLAHSRIYHWENLGRISGDLRFILPTSEFSKDTDLISGVRLSLKYTKKISDGSLFGEIRTRKNFHKYKTAGGISLSEWALSTRWGFTYKYNSIDILSYIILGNSWTYQGTRKDYNYIGYISGTYNFTDNIYIEMEATNSGNYADAEKGTASDFDLFDENTAYYTLKFGYNF